MKLFYAGTSPYARKVRILLIEKDLEDRVELVFANPFEASAELAAANPLGKVPALVRDDGDVLYDSPVICGYLDSLNETPRLIPAGSSGRWTILRREALSDGIIDAAFAMVMEDRRPEAERSASWLERWTGGILRSAAAVEDEIETYGETLTLGHIGLGAALGYLDFRLPEIDWRAGHPKIEAWFAAFSQRPSMTGTDPAS